MIEYTVKVYEHRTEWRLNGKIHREESPTVEWPDGSKEWYLNDKRHRLDGPAIDFSNGDKRWYIEGRLVTKQHLFRITNPNLCESETVHIKKNKSNLVSCYKDE